MFLHPAVDIATLPPVIVSLAGQPAGTWNGPETGPERESQRGPGAAPEGGRRPAGQPAPGQPAPGLEWLAALAAALAATAGRWRDLDGWAALAAPIPGGNGTRIGRRAGGEAAVREAAVRSDGHSGGHSDSRSDDHSGDSSNRHSGGHSSDHSSSWVDGWADGWADGEGTCLLRTKTVEVRLVRWAAGQGTRGHDHGGARSALAVVEGELVEDRFEPPLWQAGRRRRRLHAGAVATLPADHAHVLANPGPRAAASIHVVSPPSLPARARSIGAASILAELLPRT